MAIFYLEGKYQCQIEKQGFTKAQSGSLAFCLAVRVQGVVRDTGVESLPPEHQKVRLAEMYLTDKTIKRFYENLERLFGYHGSNIQNLNPEHEDFRLDLRNEVVVLECRHEEYRGIKSEKWGFPMAPRVTKATQDDVAAAASMFARAAGKNGDGTPAQDAPEEFNF